MELIAFISFILLIALIVVLHYTKGFTQALELIVSGLRPGEITTIIKFVLFTLIAISTLFFGFLTFNPVNTSQVELIAKLEEMLVIQRKLEEKISDLQEEIKQEKDDARKEFSKPKLDRDFYEESLDKYELLIVRKVALKENAQEIRQSLIDVDLDNNDNLKKLEPAQKVKLRNLKQALKLHLMRVDTQLQAVETQLAAYRKVIISEASR